MSHISKGDIHAYLDGALGAYPEEAARHVRGTPGRLPGVCPIARGRKAPAPRGVLDPRGFGTGTGGIRSTRGAAGSGCGVRSAGAG